MSSMLIHKPRRVWQPPTQGSPGGYRSHGTQGNQLSSRRACPSPHAAVPREAAAVEGVPLEFRTSSPLHSSGSLAHSFTKRFQLVECSSTSSSYRALALFRA